MNLRRTTHGSLRSAIRGCLALASLLGALALASGCADFSDWYRKYGDPSSPYARTSRVYFGEQIRYDDPEITTAEKVFDSAFRMGMTGFLGWRR